MIIDKLIDRIKETGSPICVGLDPKVSFIPEYILKEAAEEHGETLEAVAAAFTKFNKEIIDAVYDLVPIVKPQVAMYEELGPAGMKSFADTIAYAKSKGLLTIGDIKRSDIASTAEAYSRGHLGQVQAFGKSFSVYNEDFITINPYLGYDSIEPFLKDCHAFEKGLFILVKTSNANSGQLQDIEAGGLTLYERVGLLTAQWGSKLVGKYGYSSVGAVVGATYPEQAKKLREIMPNVYFLVPGYGAQGGKAEDIKVCFDKDGLGAIVNSSRGIIAAHQKEEYKNKFSEKEFAQAARQAVLDMKEDLRRCI